MRQGQLPLSRGATRTARPLRPYLQWSYSRENRAQSEGLWLDRRRLTREGVELTLGLLRRFRQSGVVVRSHQESWTETSDPRMAELLGSIYAWMAAEESSRRSERVKAGLERRRREGRPGRSSGREKDKTKCRRRGYLARWKRERQPVRG